MLWISTTCLRDAPLEIALESLGSLTRGIEVTLEGKHRIPDISLLESFPYSYMIRIPQHDINLSSLFEPIRQAGVGVLAERFALAAEVNAEVVVEPGYVSSLSDILFARRQLAKSCNDLLNVSDEYGVRFFFRNMGRGEGNIFRFVEDLQYIGRVPVALDIGHAHVNGCLSRYLHEAVSRCFYLYDCREFSEEHLEVGKGTIPFDQVATGIYANGARSIIDVPTFRDAHNSLIKLRRFGI